MTTTTTTTTIAAASAAAHHTHAVGVALGAVVVALTLQAVPTEQDSTHPVEPWQTHLAVQHLR